MNTHKNRIFLGILFAIVLYWMLVLFKPFLLDIAIASLLALATMPLHVKISKYIKNHILSSFATTFFLCFVFFMPIVYAISVLASMALHFDTSYITKTIDFFKDYHFTLPEAISFLEPKISEFISSINLASLTSKFLANIAAFGKMGAGFFTNMILIVIFFFFANAYGRNILLYLQSVLPMDDREIESIFFSLSNVMSVVFYSILLTAIFEGTLFGAMVYYFGYDGFLLGILYGFASLIPVVGGALMWVPLSAYEFANANMQNAIFIALYSIIAISIIADTFIKPLFIKYINDKILADKTSVLNELLIFFAIVAGLASFGFWGMILGPAITTFFISILKIYQELKKN